MVAEELKKKQNAVKGVYINIGSLKKWPCMDTVHPLITTILLYMTIYPFDAANFLDQQLLSDLMRFYYACW